jgi:hypothetical protein
MANLTINGATNGAVTLTVPAATGSSYTATFPAVTGNVMLQSGSTAFTTGSIPFATTGGILTQNNANLFWDNTNNRLGIGTTSPSYLFDVSGSQFPVARIKSSYTVSSKTYSSLLLGDFSSNSGCQVGWVYDNTTPANSFLHLTPYGATEGQVFQLNASGNLGLGVSPSAWSASSALQMAGGQSYSRYGITNNAYFDGASYRYISTAAATLYGNSTGSHLWFNAPSGTAGNPSTFTQAMTLDGSGILNVCSATATPAGGSTSARLVFGTTAGFGIYYGSGAPTVSAAQGSIYIRSDGSSTSTRLYVNTTGSTTWTNFTSAA